jgi:hypothetical protein
MTKSEAYDLLSNALDEWHDLQHVYEINHPENSAPYQAILESRQERYEEYREALLTLKAIRRPSRCKLSLPTR